MEERIQKLLCAVCSRRTAEAYIAAGRVTVNGQRARLGQKADPARDTVLLDGRPIPPRDAFVYLLLYKPRGYITTLSDERGRRTVAELVRGCGVRVYPVGRLDRDSEGLLLMTNDGALTRRLLHPSFAVKKTYHVSVVGAVSEAANRLAAVTDLDGTPVRPARVELLRQSEHAALLAVTIREGKKRQIRRMCEQCGLKVTRLCRVREHALELGHLKAGTWRYLRPEEIAALRKIPDQRGSGL